MSKVQDFKICFHYFCTECQQRLFVVCNLLHLFVEHNKAGPNYFYFSNKHLGCVSLRPCSQIFTWLPSQKLAPPNHVPLGFNQNLHCSLYRFITRSPIPLIQSFSADLVWKPCRVAGVGLNPRLKLHTKWQSAAVDPNDMTFFC